MQMRLLLQQDIELRRFLSRQAERRNIGADSRANKAGAFGVTSWKCSEAAFLPADHVPCSVARPLESLFGASMLALRWNSHLARQAFSALGKAATPRIPSPENVQPIHIDNRAAT